MSRATGEVYKHGSIIGYWLYNGTVDSAARPEIVDTFDECWADLYERYNVRLDWPQCPHPETGHTDVLLYSSYGPPGSHWPGKICEQCRLITDGFSPDYAAEVRGRPA